MADKLILTISGEDSDLGDRNVPFAEHYTINCSQEVDITVTETLDSVIQLRSYTASANSEQTARIEMGGLSQGQHTLTITATVGDVSVTRTLAFTLPVTYLSPLDAHLGDKGERFTIPYMAKTYSGAELQITEMLDGEIRREYTALSGAEQEMTVGTEKLIDIEHEIEIIATGDGETKSAKTKFRVAPIVLSDGGTVQEMQDSNGDPVYPATIAKAVMMASGKSVEESFTDLPPNFYEYLLFDRIGVSGVWTAPKAKKQAFRVFCVGGGGGGGNGGSGSLSSGRGGGGGGGYVSIADLTFPEGTQVSVVCGAGGGAGGDGGATSFGDYLSAEGGKKGTNATQANGGGSGGNGGSGGGSAGGTAGNGSDYGGGGGAAVAKEDKTSVSKGGDGGLYSGGGGAGGHGSLYGTGGSGGAYGGNGGGRKSPGQNAKERLSVSIVDALFDCTALRNSGNYAGGSISSSTYKYGGGGGAGAKSDGGTGGQYSGGGGGGFGGNGGNGGYYGGGGGGGFFGRGGNGGNGSGGGGGGGGGFFCKGGNGFSSAISSSTGSGGGGGGLFSDGEDGYDTSSYCYGGKGGDGGVLIMYFKEEDSE